MNTSVEGMSLGLGGAQELGDGWSLLITPPATHTLPSDIPPDAAPLPAIVPGTVAAALDAIGQFDRANPTPLIDRDAWYRRSLTDVEPGSAILRFEGLSTIADVFLDDRLILASASMFESHDVLVDLTGRETLSICFRALKPHLERTGPRARWRQRLMNNQGLRLVRTTALGFMPGWSPEIHAVGPWRPVSILRLGPATLSDLSVSSRLDADGAGILAVSFACRAPAQDMRLICNGCEAAFIADQDRFSAELRLPDVKPWWPHTHGTPALHDATMRMGDTDILLPPIGFRSVTIDRGTDSNDFAVLVNGERIFCRGAVWTSADLLGLSGDRATYEPWLRLARDAGMNMIRVPGIAVYESPAFFALCDELGLMVWQDLMLANFDYPVADADLMIHVKCEVEQFLKRTSANPSLAIVCGGSEVYQQGAMLGLPERIWKGSLFEEILPAICGETRPDLPYVANSPSGGALPFQPDTGVAHYYGVGAYLRPIEDARRANIRFAAECLAFSNLSQSETREQGKAGIPRDNGTDWDFEDVRDHYLRLLYGVDPKALREDDPHRYLALSRAVTGEVMEAAFGEWRRPPFRLPGSTCNGALTFTLQDVMPGPGWGVIDVDGNPKSAWFALKRAFRPIQISLSDEGTNGLDVHLVNETAAAIEGMLELACLREGRVSVVSGRRQVTVAPRASVSFASTDLFGAFFDTNYAYRFGPASHDVTIARFCPQDTGEAQVDAFHFPIGRGNCLHDATIEVILQHGTDGCTLDLSTDVFAQNVTIDCPGYRPQDNGFHLAPGITRRIALAPLEEGMTPTGKVRSLGSGRSFAF